MPLLQRRGDQRTVRLGTFAHRTARGIRGGTGGTPLIRLSAVALSSLIATGAVACTSASRPSPQQEARIQRSEQRELDSAFKRVPQRSLLDRYEIEDEVLTVLIPGAAWQRLGTRRQDALKRALWRPWRTVYVRHHPGTSERIFLKVEDLQGNDLGSYFET